MIYLKLDLLTYKHTLHCSLELIYYLNNLNTYF